jgi:hypothetical protein
MRVVIIGCGPAGLAAAHAAFGLGCDVVIYAPKQKTPQRGPLLIQRPIPGINVSHPDGSIRQFVVGGSILDYRYKLYGDVNIGINGDILKPVYHACRHQETYDQLWRRYKHAITDRIVSKLEMTRIDRDGDLVVSTANAMLMCDRYPYPAENGGHEFVSAEVAVTTMASYPNQPDNTIVFNAGTEYPWVRSSKIFGAEVTEWLANDEMPVYARLIRKPISNTCNCYPKVLRTGRFGAWRNETWVDTAYWDTYEAIVSMQAPNWTVFGSE